MPKRLADPSFWRRHRWPIVFGMVAVALVVSIGGTKVNSDRISHDAELGAATHQAVCALRVDLHDRYLNGVRFLEHPSIALPPAALRAYKLQLEGQRRTLRALAGLRCGA